MPDEDLVVTQDRDPADAPAPRPEAGPAAPQEAGQDASATPGRWNLLAPGRRRLIAGLSAAGVLVLGYAVAVLVTAGSVPRGTSVAGVDIGGLDREAAVGRLRERLATSEGPVTVRAGARTARLEAAAAGLSFDPGRTVDSVLGSPLDPRSVLRHLTGGGPVDAETTTDRERLRAALRTAARTLDVPARDGAVTLTAAGPRPRAAVTGTAVDLEPSVDAVATGWLASPGGVELRTRRLAPAVDQAEVDRAVKELATPATSGPLTVTVGSRTVELPTKDVVPALTIVPVDGRLDLKVDGKRLKAAVLAGDPDAETPAKDARIELRNGGPVVVPAVEGKGVDAEALAKAARTALLASGTARTVSAPLATLTPELTTDEAKALGVKEKVSSFSTKYPPNADRTNNLRIAARTVNGTLVLPGETFSLNEVLGKRTPEKGYRSAPVINNGRLEKDYGGGVSQMATTIFNNVFFAGLQDVEHKPHSFYISRYPEGREATVSFPTVDLKWRNDSPYAVLIQAAVNKTVDVTFWSTKVWDEVKAEKSGRTNIRPPKKIYDPRPSCVEQQPSPGFDVVVRRLFYKDGKLAKTQRFATSYIPEDHVICGPDPATLVPTPRPTPVPPPPAD